MRLNGAAVVVAIATMIAAGSSSARPGQIDVGVRGGFYTPGLDQEVVSGKKIYSVYRCAFNDDTLFQVGFDGDLHLFDGFGSLQLGAGVMFAQASGSALPLSAGSAAATGTRTCVEPEDGAASVELSMLFVRPALTYRFDPFLDWFGFPLVPYGRLGLMTVGYAFSSNGEFDEGGTAAGYHPVGARIGYEVAGGLSLGLDWLDLRYGWDIIAHGKSDRRAHPGYVKHSFFFVEVAHSKIDNFGQPGFVFTPEDRLLFSGENRLFSADTVNIGGSEIQIPFLDGIDDDVGLPFTIFAGVTVELD